MSNKHAMFDSVLESVGSNGPFQRRFNYIYNLIFTIMAVMPLLNNILAMTVPDHWCHVPGRENTSYTIEEWKNLTLPKVFKNKGPEIHSSCEMYNISDISNIQSGFNYSIICKNKFVLIAKAPCQYGYEYDKTWFDLTIPSQEDWVCDKDLRVPNVFVFSRIGEVLGALVFGQLGDYIGRRPVFFISLSLLITGKVMQLLLAKYYYWFVLGNLISSTISMMLYQTTLIIAMEISSSTENAHIAMTQGIGWSLGVCLLPIIYWWIRDWFYYFLISSLPVAFFLIGNRYLIESPRWLASRGRIKECEVILRKMAKINKTTLDDDALDVLKRDHIEPEKIYGMASLFSSWRLAKHALAMVTCWIVNSCAQGILALNVTNLDGNPFLNFFFQSLVEIFSFFSAKWATNTLGRKWTAAGAFICSIITAFSLLFTSTDPSLVIYTNTLIVCMRFFACISYFVLFIQGIEIYPTCVRQSGISLGIFVSNAFGILGPYVVYLGSAYDIRFPHLILLLMMLAGLLAELALPETLYHKLPETLAEAQIFGRDQKCWDYPKKSARKMMDSLSGVE